MKTIVSYEKLTGSSVKLASGSPSDGHSVSTLTQLATNCTASTI